METCRRLVRRVQSLIAKRASTSSNGAVQAPDLARPASVSSPSGTAWNASVSRSGTVSVSASSGGPPPVYKVVTVGGGGVGKSSLIVQFMYGEFLDEYEPTKVDSYRKRVMLSGEEIMLDIVDTAGQEDYAAVRDHYLRNADAYLCVFSLSEPETLQEIVDMRDQIVRVNSGRDDIPCLLVGNKADLDEHRAVEFELAARWSDLWNVQYVETSAKTNFNVDKVFYDLLKLIKATKEQRLHQSIRPPANTLPCSTVQPASATPQGSKNGQKSKKCSSSRSRARRRRIRGFRRTVRRALLRIGTCTVI